MPITIGEPQIVDTLTSDFAIGRQAKQFLYLLSSSSGITITLPGQEGSLGGDWFVDVKNVGSAPATINRDDGSTWMTLAAGGYGRLRWYGGPGWRYTTMTSAAAEVIPPGGAEGDVLSRTGIRDEEWTTPHYVPDGGTVGQVLTKASDDDYDVAWETPDTGGGGGGGTYSNTPPVEANFSWINQDVYDFAGGTSTATLFYTPSGATGVNIHARVMSAPTPPYSFKVRASAKWSAPGGVIWRFGIVLRESSSGKLVTIDLDLNNGPQPHVIKWNSPTSFNAFYTANSLLAGINTIDQRYVNFMVRDDGTDRKWYVDLFKQEGGDSENWQLVHQVSRTDFITPDQVGYFIDNEGVGAMVVSIYDWIQGT